VNVVLYQLS